MSSSILQPSPSFTRMRRRVRNVCVTEIKRGSRLLSFSPCDLKCDPVEISYKNDVGIPSYTTIMDQKWHFKDDTVLTRIVCTIEFFLKSGMCTIFQFSSSKHKLLLLIKIKLSPLCVSHACILTGSYLRGSLQL